MVLQGGVSMSSNLNLNQNFTKEMMTTKLRSDEVAMLLDSKLGVDSKLNTRYAVGFWSPVRET